MCVGGKKNRTRKVLIECWGKQVLRALLAFRCRARAYLWCFVLLSRSHWPRASQLLAGFKTQNVTCGCQLSHQEACRPLFYDSDLIWTVWFIWQSTDETSKDVTLIDGLALCGESEHVSTSAVMCQSQHLGRSFGYFSACEHRSHVEPLI